MIIIKTQRNTEPTILPLPFSKDPVKPLKISFIGSSELTSNKNALFIPRSFSLNIVNGSGGRHFFNGRDYPLHQGDVFLLTPFSPYKIFNLEGSLTRIDFSSELLSDSLFRCVYFSRGLITVFSSSELDSALTLAKALAHECERSKMQAFSNEMSNALFTSLIVGFLRKCDISSEEESNEYSPVFRKAADYIGSNFRNVITLKDIALPLGLTEGHVSEIISGALGQTFSAYVRALRLSFSCELLQITDIPSNQISSLCGFSSAAYFSSAFREELGMSPLTYRRLYSSAKRM